MASFNKVILLGNLTRDPQLSYLPSQTAVVEFGIATNRKWRGSDGQQKEEVCYVDCRAFGKPAETINKFCKKGNPLMVEGRLNYDSWTAQDGSKRSRLRVTVESFQFIGSGSNPNAGGGNNNNGGGYNQNSGGGGYSPPSQVNNNATPANNNTGGGYDSPPPPSDDDIPF